MCVCVCVYMYPRANVDSFWFKFIHLLYSVFSIMSAFRDMK